MTDEKKEFYKNLLLEKKRKTIETISQMEDRLTTALDEYSNNPKYSDSFAEFGSDSADRENTFYFITREKRYLNQIEQALENIKNGIYGICSECGKEIDPERLQAVPTTTICLSCKVKQSST